MTSRPRTLCSITIRFALASAVVTLQVTAASAATVSLTGRSTPVAVAVGVSTWRESFAVGGRRQQSVLIAVRLATRGLTVNVVAADDRVNSADETTLSMARRTHAVAGINGDLFDRFGTGAPDGGEIDSHGILKSPRQGWPAQLTVLSNRTAAIGPVSFAGSITLTSTASPTASAKPITRAITSINTTSDAAAGGITQVSPALGAASLPPGCVVVFGVRHLQDWVVRAVQQGSRSIAALGSASWALAGCKAGGTWLSNSLHPGLHLKMRTRAWSPAFPTTPISSMLSAGKILVRHGSRYNDGSGFHTFGDNPELAIKPAGAAQAAFLIAG